MLRLVIVAGLLVAESAKAQTQPAAARASITQDLRLDATAKDFPRVNLVYVGPAKQIVVPIAVDQQLRIYDSTGKKIATFGRRGGGPGEFTGLATVGWIGDSIWVTDYDQHRTTLIGPDFKLIRTEAWPARDTREGRPSSFDPIVMLAGGTWLGPTITWGSGGNGYTMQLVARAATGASRTILATSTENDERMMWVAGFGRPVPFSLQPQYAFAWTDGRVAELKAPIPARPSGQYFVTVMASSGDTVFSRTFTYRGQPIPRRVADSALAAMIPTSGHAVEGPADMPQRFQAMARERMSSWYIPVETITLGLDKTVWIGFRLSAEGRSYLVLDGTGNPIGSVVLPATSRLRQATASRLWVTETDEDGLTSIVRYHVQGLACPRDAC